MCAYICARDIIKGLQGVLNDRLTHFAPVERGFYSFFCEVRPAPWDTPPTLKNECKLGRGATPTPHSQKTLDIKTTFVVD